jgi:hypothetical protein
MKYLLLLLSLLALTPVVNADEIITLDKLNIEYLRYSPEGVDPFLTYDGLPNKALGYGLNLKMETTILSYLYWNSTVLSETDEDLATGWGQYRTIGLEMQVGIRLTQWLDVGYYHLSRHLMDTPQPNGQAFQRMDALQFTLKLYDNKKIHEPVW